MKSLELIKRKEIDLLDQYYSGNIDADEVLNKLFNSNDADRVRKNIERKRQKINGKRAQLNEKELQESY